MIIIIINNYFHLFLIVWNVRVEQAVEVSKNYTSQGQNLFTLIINNGGGE